METEKPDEFEDDNTPTLPELLEYYRLCKDSYIQALHGFWRLPIQKKFEQAVEGNEDVIEAVEALMNFARIDKEEESYEKKAIMAAKLGDMCDEEITTALNQIAGNASFGRLVFTSDGEIDVDEESIDTFIELYTKIITNKTENDFVKLQEKDKSVNCRLIVNLLLDRW